MSRIKRPPSARAERAFASGKTIPSFNFHLGRWNLAVPRRRNWATVPQDRKSIRVRYCVSDATNVAVIPTRLETRRKCIAARLGLAEGVPVGFLVSTNRQIVDSKPPKRRILPSLSLPQLAMAIRTIDPERVFRQAVAIYDAEA